MMEFNRGFALCLTYVLLGHGLIRMYEIASEGMLNSLNLIMVGISLSITVLYLVVLHNTRAK